jgi:hypothetical protein
VLRELGRAYRAEEIEQVIHHLGRLGVEAELRLDL